MRCCSRSALPRVWTQTVALTSSSPSNPTMDRVDANGFYIAEHGSPWNYDRRVPIVFWRPGHPGYEQYLPVETGDIAPTRGAPVGRSAPAGASGRPDWPSA